MSAIKQRNIQRGRLLERITQQRATLAAELAPVACLLKATDGAMTQTHKVREWLTEHLLMTGAGLIALVLWRPRGALKLLRNGIAGWRTLRLICRLLV